MTVAVLHDKNKLKPQVKPRGRPKKSAKFWASKSRKRQIDSVSKISVENKPKKLKLPGKFPQSKEGPAGTSSFHSQVCRQQRSRLKEVNCATEPIQIDGSTESDSGSSVQYDELCLLQTDKKKF